MAKRQSEYLTHLLANEPSPPALSAEASSQPMPAHRAGLSLLGRDTALARIATGEVRQVTQLSLDPARVRIWPGNARLQGALNEQNCRDLIDSIIAEGGQKVPAVVRHVRGDPDHDYELVAGTRRHFAISWLRGNSYPDMRLLAQVAELDDEAAFRLADVENRSRKDISDLERARNYAAALDAHYGGKAIRMAERMRVSKGWLSKMLKAATLDDTLIAVFPDLTQLSLRQAYKLAVAADDSRLAKAMTKEAATIIAENNTLLAQDRPPIPGITIARRLLSVRTLQRTADETKPITITGSKGRPVVTVVRLSRQGVTLHLPAASGASADELMAALGDVLERLRSQGVDLT